MINRDKKAARSKVNELKEKLKQAKKQQTEKNGSRGRVRGKKKQTTNSKEIENLETCLAQAEMCIIKGIMGGQDH